MNIDKKILLTVAIPTYNRASELEKTIIQLSKERGEPFYILISDNNSTDNTEAVVKKYQKLIPNLIYNKNTLNLGYSGNVCKLYELSPSRYIWFLCDDDTVLSGSVLKIILAIKKYKPFAAIFNCSWTDPYGRKLFAGVTHDKFYKKIENLTDYSVILRAGFLSILVIEKRISITKLKKTNYRDNVFFQISLLLLLLSDKIKLCEIATTVVHRNVGFKYGEFYKSCLVDLLQSIHIRNHNFSIKKFIYLKKKMIFMELQLYLSQKLGLFRYSGQITSKTKRLVFRYYGFFHGLILMSFPIINLIIPTGVIKFLYMIKLISIHGYRNGSLVYHGNIDRAIKDERETGFI